jgi:hypothetical protein
LGLFIDNIYFAKELTKAKNINLQTPNMANHVVKNRKPSSMGTLKTARTVLAVAFGLALTLLFLDFTGTLHSVLGWMAKIQFMPALLALNMAVIVGLAALTLLFGRLYCSVICPLGIFQDVVSRVAGRYKKRRFVFSPEQKVWRYGVLALFVVAFCGRYRLSGGLARSLWPLRTDGSPIAIAHLSMGKQPIGLLCRTYRQLPFLQQRSLAHQHWHLCSGHRFGRDYRLFGLAQRTNLLQHGLPCWYNIGAYVALFTF